MQILRTLAQTPREALLLVALTPEEAALPDNKLVEAPEVFAPRGGAFWGGSVVERRPGRRTATVYAKLALWKD